ncbi:MAG TPA: hypothetical protein VGL91_20715 [Acidobacteriota bacterium]
MQGKAEGRRRTAEGWRQEAGGRRQEAGSRKQEAGSRRQEAGKTLLVNRHWSFETRRDRFSATHHWNTAAVVRAFYSQAKLRMTDYDK